MESQTRTGTQSVERAILLLKAVATRGTTGWRLTDLAAACDLDKSTAHRLLGCLRTQRLVDRDDATNRFIPGPLIAELSLSAHACQPYLDECRSSLGRLARRTGAASFSYLASCSEFVVASRVEYRRHSNLLHTVGWRRPLLTSVGGVAILIGMDAGERERVVSQNVGRLQRDGKQHRIESLRRMLDRSMDEGFASNLQEAAQGVHSFAATVRDAKGRTIASISIADVADSLPAGERRRYAMLLNDEVAILQEHAVPLLDHVDRTQ